MGVAEALVTCKILSEKSAESIKNVETVIDGVTSIFSDVDAVKTVLKLVGLLEDEYSKKLDEISGKLDEIARDLEIDTSALAGIVKALHIADLNGELHTSIMNFQHHIDDPQNPLYDVESFFSVPLKVANTLIDEAYWRSFYADSLNFNNPWTGTLAPPDASGGLVWEYRVTLPTYLGAIASRILMLQALEPDFRSNELYRMEIKSYAEHLLTIHNKIVQDGIVGIRLPDYVELILSYVHLKWETLEEKTWKGHKYIYGLVERYSGFNQLKAFQPTTLELSQVPKINAYLIDGYIYHLFPVSYEAAEFKIGDLDYLVAVYMLGYSEVLAFSEPYSFPDCHPVPSINEFRTNIFLPKYFVRLAKLWQDFYSKLGMPELWCTINNLRSLAGDSPLDAPDCTCLSNLIPSMESSLFMRLSLRNVYRLIVKALEFGGSDYIKDHTFSSPGHPISMLEIAAKLRVKSPISLRRLYED